MTMNRPAEDRVPPDPGGSPPPDGAWLEARIPAVFVAVVATWLLIAGWKVFRHLAG